MAPGSGAPPSRRHLRKFGLTVGGAFLVLAAISRWRGHVWPPAVMATLGTLLVAPGLLAPMVLAPVERGWMAFAEVLGRFNARIILSALYWLVITPVGLVRRRSADPLDRRLHDGRATSWIARTPETPDIARYRQQF
jgi:hypothetical protein